MYSVPFFPAQKHRHVSAFPKSASTSCVSRIFRHSPTPLSPPRRDSDPSRDPPRRRCCCPAEPRAESYGLRDHSLLQLLEHDGGVVVSAHHPVQLLALSLVQQCAALERLVVAVDALHCQRQLQADVATEERLLLDVAEESRRDAPHVLVLSEERDERVRDRER